VLAVVEGQMDELEKLLMGMAVAVEVLPVLMVGLEMALVMQAVMVVVGMDQPAVVVALPVLDRLEPL